MSGRLSLAAAAPTTVDGGPRKAKGQGGERREEILEHARRLFAADGVHSVSTRRIADAVGISQPTLYAYFPRKADILEEVSARAFGDLRRASELTSQVGGDPLERIVRDVRVHQILEGANDIMRVIASREMLRQ